MSSKKFIVYISLCLLLSFNQALARRVRGEIEPIDSLIKEGYYIAPNAKKEIGKDIKVISFDWGGVLDMAIKDDKIKNEIEDLLDAFQKAKIDMVIVSEGGREEIKGELKKLGWDKYFEEIHQAFSNVPQMTKRAILARIAKEKEIAKNQIVHFEDTPSQIENIGFRMGKEPEIFVVGVVGRQCIGPDDNKFIDLAEKIIGKSPVIISYLGIGVEKILKKILNMD